MTENKQFIYRYNFDDKSGEFEIIDLIKDEHYPMTETVVKGLIDCLNELFNENKQLKKENKHLQCTIESNSQDDYIDFLEKQNERLKEIIEELSSNDKIVFMTG